MISCYLDSQDYSALTDPKLTTPELREIKTTLLHLARSKQVRFAFSAAVVCESTSLTKEATYLAELKAELLSDLCGSNALKFFDRVIFAEVSALASRSHPPYDMFDIEGKWFPEIPIDEEPQHPQKKVFELIDEEMRANGFSRQERRAKIRAFTKSGKSQVIVEAVINQLDPKTVEASLIAKYPMRPDLANVVVRYALGKATGGEFSEALMDSLKDPKWMMKWFTTEHSLHSPVAEIVRKPGRELGQLMRSLADISTGWATALQDINPDCDPTGKAGELTLRWKEMETRQLFSIIEKFGASRQLKLGVCKIEEIAIFCPGITACVKSLYSSVWANVGEGRKEEPSDSQPVDAMHALYAPYVRVFRADRFMAPHIQKFTKRNGTIVVPRLNQLVSVLDGQLF